MDNDKQDLPESNLAINIPGGKNLAKLNYLRFIKLL